jgi:hypothetical protein
VAAYSALRNSDFTDVLSGYGKYPGYMRYTNGVVTNALLLSTNGALSCTNNYTWNTGTNYTIAFWLKGYQQSKNFTPSSLLATYELDDANYNPTIYFTYNGILAQNWYVVFSQFDSTGMLTVDLHSGNLLSGLWIHFITTYDGTNLMMFTNGILAASASCNYVPINLMTNTLIECDISGYVNSRAMDELIVWGRALHTNANWPGVGVTNEILRLYQKQSAGLSWPDL